MNNKRRSVLRDVSNTIVDLIAAVESVRDDEQDAFDNLPEGLQSSQRGEAMEEAIDNLEDAIDSLTDANASISTAREQ